MTTEQAPDADLHLANALIDEAMEGMALPVALLPILRATLLAELLATPHGRAMLRRAAADPQVKESGDVATQPALAAEKAGGDRR